MNDRRTQTTLPDGTSWRYGYDRLSQVVSGERVDAEGTPVQDGSFRYAYDGIGNRTFSQDGAPDAIRRYSSNALNQYTAIAETGFIPLGGRADEDANVVVTATVDGRSETYEHFAKIHLKALFRDFGGSLLQVRQGVVCYDAKHLKQNAPKERKVAKATFAKGSHVPVRDGQGFSVDIPVDNSRGAVTATVRVDALKHDGQQASDLHRSLAGEYTVAAAVPETLSYDADGNMLTNDGWTYARNAQDRLVSAAKGTIRLEFAYDYMGRCFEKKVYENNVLTKRSLYAYDGFKQIAEYDALDNNALLNTYLWQPEGLDVPLLRNGSEFYVSDANKNVVALMDTTGAVTDTYVYDPFGNCAHTGDSTNPFRFSSEFHDDETGLVYYNYRYYSPELGRWIKRDPIGERGGMNLFGNSNKPNQTTDHLGLFSYKQCTPATKIVPLGNWYFSELRIRKETKTIDIGVIPAQQDLGEVIYLHKAIQIYKCKCKCNSSVQLKERKLVFFFKLPVASKDAYQDITWHNAANAPSTIVPINNHGIIGYIGEDVSLLSDSGIHVPVDVPDNFWKDITQPLNRPLYTGKDEIMYDSGIPKIFCL